MCVTPGKSENPAIALCHKIGNIGVLRSLHLVHPLLFY